MWHFCDGGITFVILPEECLLLVPGRQQQQETSVRDELHLHVIHKKAFFNVETKGFYHSAE